MLLDHLSHALVTAPGQTPDRWMLFLHGILGSGANWRTVARKIVAARPQWGAVLVDLIESSLVRWPLVSEFWREAVLGALILLSVSADAVLMRRLNRMRVDWQIRRKQGDGKQAKVAP